MWYGLLVSRQGNERLLRKYHIISFLEKWGVIFDMGLKLIYIPLNFKGLSFELLILKYVYLRSVKKILVRD